MNLYLRLVWVWVRAWFRPRMGMDDIGRLTFRVLPNDLDLNRHMNNGRYLTLLDLSMIDALTRSGFIKAVMSLGAMPMLGGSMITYRRQLKLFAKYHIDLKYLSSTPQWHVFSFTFVSSTGAVAAKGLLKGGVVNRKGLVPTADVWRRHAELTGEAVQVPPMPEVATNWLAVEQAVFALD